MTSVTRAEVIALSSLPHVPTARVVFDTGESPSYYLKAIRQLRPVSYTMGELIDSSYMQHYKSVSAVQSWTSSYVNTLGSQVDIWEVGNEINGNWLSKQWKGADVMPKGEAIFDIVFAQGGKTELTFFYEESRRIRTTALRPITAAMICSPGSISVSG